MLTALRVVGMALLLAIALAALAPPAVVNPALQQASAGVLSLVDTEGTVWRGRATLAAGGQRLPLSWQVDPLALLRGDVVLRIAPHAAGGRTPRGRIDANRQGVAISDATITLPAAMLLAGRATPGPLALGGEIIATTPRLESTGSMLAGVVELHWRAASVHHAPGRPALALGEVAASLQGTTDRLVGPLRNDGGAVAIRGELGIDRSRGIALDLLVTPRDAADARLAALLRSIGRAEGDGWRLQWPVSAR